MFYVLQNESTAARRKVPILLTDASTGTTAQTGVATTNIYAYVNINGGAFIGGTGNVGEAGFGQYYYEFESNEVATLGLAGIHVTALGCRDYDAITQIAAFDLYSASAGGGISAYDVWNYTNTYSGNVTELDLSNASQFAQNADTNTSSIIGSQYPVSDIWNYDISSNTDPSAGFNLYQLGIGATGYAAVGLTAGDVWDYASRTITGGIADTVTLVTSPVDISYPSMAGLANTIWSSDVSGYTSPSAGFDLTQSASGTALTSGDVWTYASRTITGGIADTVTTITDRSGFAITGGTITTVSDKTGYSLSSTQAFDLTGNITGNLSGSVGSVSGAVGSVTNPVDVSTASMAGIANTVWSTLTAPYTTHATFGHQILRSDNAATIGEVTLHQSGGSKRVDADVHAFVNNTASATAMLNILTGIGASMTTNITGNLSGSVGSVTSPVDVSTSSMSGIANTVWSTDISGYTSPSAGFDLSNVAGGGITAGDVWSYATREITGGIADTVTTVSGNVLGSVNSVVTDVTISTGTQSSIANSVWSADVSGYTSPSAGFDLSNASSGAGLTAGDVWSYATREITGGIADTVTSVSNGVIVTTNNDKTGYALSSTQTFDLTGNITGNLSGSVGSVTNPVTFDSAQYASIASSVWNAGTRTLTSSGSGLTAGDVWTYATREITGGIADTVTTLTNRSGFAITGGTVYTVTNGVTVTTNNDKTGYSLSSTQTFDVTGNITGNVSGSVGSVTSAVTFESAQYAAIASSVWNAATRTLTSGSGISASDVWTYGSRTITGGIADTVTTVSGNVLGSVNSVVTDVTLSAGTQASIANSVWSFDISTGPASPSASYYINNINTEAQSAATDASTAASNTNDIGGTVWGYDPTALTSPQAGAILTDIQTDTNSIITDIGNVPNNVWASDVSGYSTPGEAGFELTQAAAGAGLTSGDVWSYATRTITGGIADTVTTITDRSGFAITGGTVDTVTNPVTFDSVQYAGIASSVWNAATRTLTSSGSGISAFDVWNFVLSDSNTAEVDLVQAAAGSGLTAGDVWSAPSRTITGGIADTVTTLTNRSGFAITGGTVDTVTNGVTVSTNNDKTGYSLSGTQSFNLTGNITGNLSGSVGSVTSGVTVTTNNDKTGYALSGAGVSAVQSGLSTLTQAQVGTEVDSSLSNVGLTTTVTGRIDATVSSRLASASYTAPPTEAAIWSYSPRTLTSGAGASAYEVWNFATRSLTSGAGITVSAATNIINGPYFVKSNVDSQDGTLDVIRGMVQDIQLTVTDAFQNPFDVTALGLAVNFYDQAGTLVTSYGTSNLYAPAGLVQFTLDTAVTANEGRYNLILSAAGSGNTIKFGPLQTLVRPF